MSISREHTGEQVTTMREKKYTSHLSFRVWPEMTEKLKACSEKFGVSDAKIFRLVLELARWDEVAALAKVRFKK